MNTVTGTLRNGKIELHGPPPPTWADGMEVVVSEPAAETVGIDITGDSPEAIAAGLKWFDELHAMPVDEEAADELEQILRDIKQARREGAHAEMLAWTRLSTERRSTT